jgi:PIN domain nuclease of toxin-antitoxin system
VRLLLDTHVWLWLQLEPERLTPSTLNTLEDEGNDLLLSAASSWEIAIKHALGKIDLPESPTTYVPSRMQRHGVVGLPVEHAHALAVGQLPQHHRDPFDRLLIAQASAEQLTIVTLDSSFAAYDVALLEA